MRVEVFIFSCQLQ